MLPISRVGVIYLHWLRRLQRQLHPHGITIKQLHVLQELLRRKVLYPASIAEGLYCDRPTASVIIANLEKQGWIVKERDEENRKRFQIRITEAGKAKVEAVLASGFQGNRGLDLSQVFRPDEEAMLSELLRRLQNHIEVLP